MAQPIYRLTCRGCGRRREEHERFSWTGLCRDCGPRRSRDNLLGLATHSGPAFDHWRKQMAASVGAVLADESDDSA